MSHRGIDPNDYEYDGSESANVVAPAKEVARTARFQATTALTTAVLAAAGLVGGAAFALTNSATNQSSTSLPAVQSPSTESVANPSTTPSETSSPTATPTPTTDASATQNTAGGKTIAVPPAAFQDKNGERDFHGSKPAAAPSAAASAASTAEPSPAASFAAPSFGGGGDGHDGHDGGDHHRKNQTSGSTSSPNFTNGNEDD